MCGEASEESFEQTVVRYMDLRLPLAKRLAEQREDMAWLDQIKVSFTAGTNLEKNFRNP